MPPSPLGEDLRLPLRSGRAEALADLLTSRIRDAGLAEGDRIGDLEQLHQMTGLARSTVSAAVRLLRERGVVEIRPGRSGGLFVAPSDSVVRLRHTLLSVRDAVPVADAIEVREHLELLVDTDAARYCADADRADLRSLLAGLHAAAGRPSTFLPANWALHRRIAAIARNRIAADMYLAMLDYVSGAAETVATDDDDRWQAYAADRFRVHEDLVTAIVAGDEPAVAAAVRRHRAAGA
jgi:GntR family transcriptional regulator, transcriptional repressor for pyruvate dehydrogenase complex